MRRWTYGSVVVALVGMLVACGAPAAPAAKSPPAASTPAAASPAATSGSASAPAAPAAPPPGPPTAVTVGQVAAVMYPFYIGLERGYFREQGIDLQYETFRSGAEMVPLIA